MAEYIEREQVYEALYANADGEQSFDMASARVGAYERIKAIPSADVQPVVRGEWIKNEGRHGWHCSVCGEDDLYAFAWNCDKGENELQDRYCPNCGARMDGDNNG